MKNDAEQYIAALTSHVLDVRGRPHRAAWLADLLGTLVILTAGLSIVCPLLRFTGMTAAGVLVMARAVVRQHPPMSDDFRRLRATQIRTVLYDAGLVVLLGVHALTYHPQSQNLVVFLTVGSLFAFLMLYYSLIAMLLVVGRGVLKTHAEEMRILDEMQIRQNRHWPYGSSFLMGLAGIFLLLGDSLFALMIILLFGNWLWMQHSAFFWRARARLQS